jgi:hypothetical protein
MEIGRSFMRRIFAMRALLGIAGFAMLANTFCYANPLDDCTLKNMVGVTSDAAAKFVRRACIGQISAAIPSEELSIQATAAMGKGQYDNNNTLYVTIQNNSHYAITEMMIRVSTDNNTKWNDYEVTTFAPARFMLGSPPPDPTVYMQIKPFTTVTFFVDIREPNLPNEKWTWRVLSAKGFLAAQ